MEVQHSQHVAIEHIKLYPRFDVAQATTSKINRVAVRRTRLAEFGYLVGSHSPIHLPLALWYLHLALSLFCGPGFPSLCSPNPIWVFGLRVGLPLGPLFLGVGLGYFLLL